MKTWNNALAWCVGALALAAGRPTASPQRGGERGLSQSTENAILLAGAVTVAGIIVTVITAYVKSHLPV